MNAKQKMKSWETNLFVADKFLGEAMRTANSLLAKEAIKEATLLLDDALSWEERYWVGKRTTKNKK